MTPADVLYVVDLDGTLLHDDGALSPRSRALLGELVEDDAPITIASARSLASIRVLLADIDISLPVIEFNGAFLSVLATGEHLSINHLDGALAARVHADAVAGGHHPFLSTFDGQRDRLYAPPPTNEGMRGFLTERRAMGDERLTPVDDTRVGLGDQVVCLTMIGTHDPLRRLHQQLAADYGEALELHWWENRYSPGWFWVAVHDPRATKDRAVRELIENQGLAPVEVVAFGDQHNDVAMLRAADRGVAVANAIPEVRAIADEVIGANTEDSVMRYIDSDWRQRRGGGASASV